MMKRLIFFIATLAVPCLALAENRIYMVGKVKILDTTHTQVVLFYDKGITTMSDCYREVQRGNRGQWRYHHHKFPPPNGYMQRIDYYCVESKVVADPWYNKAPYDFVYKVDIRNPQLRIAAKNSYSDCLHDLRREVHDETSKFFCAKLSQGITL